MKLLEIELQLKEKLKIAIMIPPTLCPTAAWGSWRCTVLCCGLCCTHRDYWSLEGFGEIIFLSYQPKQEAKAWPWLPALASPTLMVPVHQNSQQKTFPHSRHSTVQRQEPQAAVGYRVGRIIMATFSFAFSWSSTSTSFMMKCLRYFLLEILKKTVSP